MFRSQIVFIWMAPDPDPRIHIVKKGTGSEIRFGTLDFFLLKSLNNAFLSFQVFRCVDTRSVEEFQSGNLFN